MYILSKYPKHHHGVTMPSCPYGVLTHFSDASETSVWHICVWYSLQRDVYVLAASLVLGYLTLTQLDRLEQAAEWLWKSSRVNGSVSNGVRCSVESSCDTCPTHKAHNTVIVVLLCETGQSTLGTDGSFCSRAHIARLLQTHTHTHKLISNCAYVCRDMHSIAHNR